MRIAIDARALTGRYTGDRTYWRGLLSELHRQGDDVEYLLYSRTEIPPGELPDGARYVRRVLPAKSDRTWTFFTLPAALREDGAALAHVQYTTPLRAMCPCPIVTTVHDISFRLYPEWFPLKDRLLLNLTIPISLRQASRVITDSDSSRADILKVYRIGESKLTAIPLGVADAFNQRPAERTALAKYGIDGPFLLAVGVLQPRKNLLMLAAAFGQAQREYGLIHRLVIAGKAGWETDQAALRQAAAATGGESAAAAIHFPGYIADDDLPDLYRLCDAFAYPSLYEGFGLPPIEAMACGAPVLVSDAPALPEVVGSAACIVPVRDVAAWSRAIGAMLTDPAVRRRYAEAGPDRAACFRWSHTAALTYAVYRDCIGGQADRRGGN